MKFPGTYAAYAVIMSIFGQTINGIHLGLLLVNAATIVLVFFLGRRLANSIVGLAAGTSYAVLSVSPTVLGLAGHATHFVLLPVLAGTLLLLDDSYRNAYRRLFASGLLFGVGAVMKQPALFFIPFGAIYLLWNDLYRRRILKEILLRNLIFGIAAIVPLGVTFLILWHAGVFDKFWFWTVSYAGQYGSFLIGEIYNGRWPLSRAVQLFARHIMEAIGAGWMLWALAGLGLIVGLLEKKSRARHRFFGRALRILGFGGVPGTLFSASLLYHDPASDLAPRWRCNKQTVRFSDRSNNCSWIRPTLSAWRGLSMPLVRDKQIFFGVSPVDACGIIYPENPFVESIRIADYLREHTSPDDTIAVLGSEPQIYFYSHRHSATGYIYTYGLMETQKYAQQMQQEMIREIEHTSPKYLVSVAMFYSWLGRPGSDRSIFTWANEYTAQNYTVAGFVNIYTTQSRLLFRRCSTIGAQMGKYILIYERKS